MNSLTSRQRKIVFAVAILVLLGPIIYLGAPLSMDARPGEKTQVQGGLLARMRHDHELGESTLGDIDPSSAAANLMLLGLRGVAASVLHQTAIDQQARKDWARLKSTVDAILRLQPHYIEVWKFQGWNLAFNVSREWDRVDDRFYWVKEGLKFLQTGSERNRTSAFLMHNVGDFVGRKIGNSDEKKFFRRFFINDPDTDQFDGGADRVINPKGQDNYLVAYDKFILANEIDEVYPVKGMTKEVFRKSPAQALFDYASAISREGKFDESAVGWRRAHESWTEDFGNEIFEGLDGVRYKCNCTDEELQAMATENEVPLDVQRRVWDRRLKMMNYRFWDELSQCEQDPLTISARKAIYAGKQAHADGDISDSVDENGERRISPAQRYFEDGMQKTADMFEKYPNILVHDEKILDALLAIHYWRDIHKHNGKTPPTDHPLADLERQHAAYQSQMLMEFRRETN